MKNRTKEIQAILDGFKLPVKKLLAAPDGNPKLAKSLKLNILTTVLHLAPSDMSGYNTCPMASLGCKQACLATAGRGGMVRKGETLSDINKARIRKTIMFYEDRERFFDILIRDIKSVQRKAEREGFEGVGIRLNGTSDIRFEVYKVNYKGKLYQNIFEIFPEIQFYDYTALPNRKNIPANYHLTFSRKENNDPDCFTAIANGFNVSVVFSDFLPKTYFGLPVINGDDHDYRPIDKKGVIVGLIAKGIEGKKDTSGFVVDSLQAQLQETVLIINKRKKG